MRSLTTVLCGCALLVALGCPKADNKPIPVKTEGTGTPSAATGDNATPDAGGATTTQPGGVNADEADMATATAEADEQFRQSLANLREAMEQDIALAAEVRTQETMAMEKLGEALSDEVAKREQQEQIIAKSIIHGLKQKGFKVWANIVDIPKPLPAPASAILDPLRIGETSRVIEWEGGYGLIRKMGETPEKVRFGYIYATKDAANAPAAMENQPVAADGTAGATTDGGTTGGDGTTTTPPGGGH